MEHFSNLNDAQFTSLTTFRKSGDAVPTPVWFANDGDTLYMTTMRTSGKVKRIRNDRHVTVAPCTRSGEVTGPATTGQAHVIEDNAEAKKADALLSRKYGFMKRLIGLFHLVRGQRADEVYLRVQPETVSRSTATTSL